MRLLISGIDTLECAYYLGPGPVCKLDFVQLREQREFMRQSKHPEAGVIELGGIEFLLSPNGTASGYPFRLSNQLCTIQFGEFNDPSFFVTFRSLALWTRGARQLHQQFLDWALSLGLVVVRPEGVSRCDFTFDFHLPSVDFDEDSFVSAADKDSQHRKKACCTPAVSMPKMDGLVLSAFADKVLTPERLREMLREMKGHLKNARGRQDEVVRTLQKELAELELATNRLYEAVEKDLLPMDEMLRERAQKLKARRDAVLVEMAGARRQGEMPVAMLSAKQVDAFGAALRTRLMDSSSGATKRYLRQFVGDIRFDGKRVVMRGRKAALLAAAAENEMGTARVPTSVPGWLLDLGSNQGPTD